MKKQKTLRKYDTKLIKVNPKNFFSCELEPAIKLLQSGEVLAFPTETVYGLGANAFDKNAVKKIFKAKNRPADNPTIVHICDEKQLSEVVDGVPKIAQKLIDEFWPGPLTLVLKKSDRIPFEATAGLDSVAVRMPSSSIALALIKESGFPIAAPSANSSTKPSPTTAKHVLNDLDGKIPLIIDGGDCEVGLESTVISLIELTPILLRPGKISVKEIEDVVGKIIVPESVHDTSKVKVAHSPGMKYKHYSPNAEVVLVLPSTEANVFAKKALELGKDKKFGVISFSKKVGVKNEFYCNSNQEVFAKELFKVFREFDSKGIELIIVEGIAEEDLGLAIMNRLRKAASRVIKSN